MVEHSPQILASEEKSHHHSSLWSFDRAQLLYKMCGRPAWYVYSKTAVCYDE